MSVEIETVKLVRNTFDIYEKSIESSWEQFSWDFSYTVNWFRPIPRMVAMEHFCKFLCLLSGKTFICRLWPWCEVSSWMRNCSLKIAWNEFFRRMREFLKIKWFHFSRTSGKWRSHQIGYTCTASTSTKYRHATIKSKLICEAHKMAKFSTFTFVDHLQNFLYWHGPIWVLTLDPSNRNFPDSSHPQCLEIQVCPNGNWKQLKLHLYQANGLVHIL